jgi:hypothetical protein
MAEMYLEGHIAYCMSVPKENYQTPDNQYNYRVRLLIDIKSEIGNTQIQLVSNATKLTEWSGDDNHLAFSKAFTYLKKMVDNDSTINVFRENIILYDIEKKPAGELLSEFTIEILENSENHKNLSAALSQIKKAQNCFSECKDKLRLVLDWGPSQISYNYYNIRKAIDYLSDVNNGGVVSGPNKDGLRIIRNAVEELKGRKITSNSNYQSTLSRAKTEIYSLGFPNFFNSNLPHTEIQQVLNEIH